MFNLGTHEDIYRTFVGCHIHEHTYGKSGAHSSKAVTLTDERLVLVMTDEAMEEKDGANEIDVGNVKLLESIETKKTVI